MAASCGEESSFPTSLSNHLRLHQRLGGECHHKIQLPHPELTTRRSNLRCHLKWKYQDVEETSPAINIDTMEQDADGADLLPDQAPESNKLYNSSNCQYFSTEQSPIIGWTCHKLKSLLIMSLFSCPSSSLPTYGTDWFMLLPYREIDAAMSHLVG